MYLIEPMNSSVVQAQPDPFGLQAAIVYDFSPETNEISFLRFNCANESVLSIMDIDYDEISWYGENIEGYAKGKLKERSTTPLLMVQACLTNAPIPIATTSSLSSTSSSSTSAIPNKYVKDPVRRLLEKNPGADIASVGGLPSILNAHGLGSDKKDEVTCVLDKWDVEYTGMKSASATAEAKLARTRDEQIAKLTFAHSIAAAASLAEKEKQEKLAEEARERELEAEKQRLREEQEEKLQLALKRQREKELDKKRKGNAVEIRKPPAKSKEEERNKGKHDHKRHHRAGESEEDNEDEGDGSEEEDDEEDDEEDERKKKCTIM